MERRFNIKKRDRSTAQNSGIEFSKISNHWIFKIVTISLSALFLYAVTNSIILMVKKIDFLKEAEGEVQNLRLQNLHLSVGIMDMSTDKYLEKEARDRLNFGGEGEVVFVIPKSTLELATKQLDQIINPATVSVYERESNIYEWVDFVITGI